MKNTKTNFIDPTWSLLEVKEHLKKTVFSNENLAPVNSMLSKKIFYYRRQWERWERTRDNEELFKIFPILPYYGNFLVKLLVVPYLSKKEKNVKLMCFAVFNYKNYKSVAALIEDEVVIYTWHCMERYAERFLCQHPSQLSFEMIGEMLIYNNMKWLCSFPDYTLQYQWYDIVRDGMYCCTNEKGMWLRKTFISRDMFFSSQVKFYNDNLPELNQYLKEQGKPPINVIMNIKDGMAA